jgi:CBS domain-containing protein
MQVRDLMAKPVLTATPAATVAAIAKLMSERKVGSVVLCEAAGAIAGIFTDRDFLNVAAKGLDPKKTKVADHMTKGIESIAPRIDVVDAGRLMSERGFRHLPVVEKGELVGIISIRDLLAWSVRELQSAEELAQIEKGQELLAIAVEPNNT